MFRPSALGSHLACSIRDGECDACIDTVAPSHCFFCFFWSLEIPYLCIPPPCTASPAQGSYPASAIHILPLELATLVSLTLQTCRHTQPENMPSQASMCRGRTRSSRGSCRTGALQHRWHLLGTSCPLKRLPSHACAKIHSNTLTQTSSTAWIHPGKHGPVCMLHADARPSAATGICRQSLQCHTSLRSPAGPQAFLMSCKPSWSRELGSMAQGAEARLPQGHPAPQGSPKAKRIKGAHPRLLSSGLRSPIRPPEEDRDRETQVHYSLQIWRSPELSTLCTLCLHHSVRQAGTI